MIRKLIVLYRKYEAYVRVDLIMYAAMILMIIIYFLYVTLFE